MSERPTQQEVEIARAGLLEITDAKSVGDAFARVDEVDGVVSVLFHCTLDGYPGWHWTVSIAAVDGEAPTVLEAELQPGDGALLAPDWVPWADRLADYQASQQAEAEPDDDDDEDFDDEGGHDLEDDGDDVYDGVDVDELATGAQHDDEQQESDQHAGHGREEHGEPAERADDGEHDEDHERD